MEDGSSFPWQACLLQLSGGTVAGLAVGYAAKAAVRAVLLALGSALIFLALFAHSGFITVHWSAINAGIEATTHSAGKLAYEVISQLSSSFVGFTAGAVSGWRMRR